MAILFDSSRKDHSDSAMRAGDGLLNAVVVILLVVFAFGSWYFYGSVRPMVDSTNPSLMVQAAPAPQSAPTVSPSRAAGAQ
jgi:hypothetical protein